MKPTRDSIEVLIHSSTPEELITTITDLMEAAYAAQRGLKGEYPWYIHGRASQKEARETALSIVKRSLDCIHTKMNINRDHIWMTGLTLPHATMIREDIVSEMPNEEKYTVFEAGTYVTITAVNLDEHELQVEGNNGTRDVIAWVKPGQVVRL